MLEFLYPNNFLITRNAAESSSGGQDYGKQKKKGKNRCGGVGHFIKDCPSPGDDLTTSYQYIFHNADFDTEIITARQRSCEKIMFSVVSVCPEGGSHVTIIH